MPGQGPLMQTVNADGKLYETFISSLKSSKDILSSLLNRVLSMIAELLDKAGL